MLQNKFPIMSNLTTLQKEPGCEDYETSPLSKDYTFLQPRTLQASDFELEREFRTRRKYAIGTITAAGFILISLIVACMVLPVNNSIKISESYADCDFYSKSVFQTFVKINVSVFTGLEFSEAKILDVAIDLLFGQGGRALHGWVAWVQLTLLNQLANSIF